MRKIKGMKFKTEITLIANSNTNIKIFLDKEADDFVVKLAKKYTDNYEDAEIYVQKLEEQENDD